MDREKEIVRVRGERARRKILDETIKQVFESGFREVSVESIAAGCGVAKTTIYRRWPNKAAVVMDAFMDRVGSGTLFPPAERAMERVRQQMLLMAKVFRDRDGALVKALLGEAQFDEELAKEFLDRWTLPRRAMGVAVIRDAIRSGEVRPDTDPEAVIDLLYAPIYYRLQIGTGPLSEAYIEGIFRLALTGIGNKESPEVRLIATS